MTNTIYKKYSGHKEMLGKAGHLVFTSENKFSRHGKNNQVLQKAGNVTKSINQALILLNKLQNRESKTLVVYGQRLERQDIYYRPSLLPEKKIHNKVRSLTRNNNTFAMVEGLSFGALSNWQGLRARAIKNLFLLNAKDKRFLKTFNSFKGLLIPQSIIRSLFQPVSRKGKAWNVTWAYKKKPDIVFLINPDKSTMDEVAAKDIPFFVLGTQGLKFHGLTPRRAYVSSCNLPINCQPHHMADELLSAFLNSFYKS